MNPAQAWKALTDAETLRKAIPGVDSIRQTGPNEYRAVMNVGVGIVRGRFSGTVKLTDMDEPRFYRMSVSGNGPGGWIKGESEVTLREEKPGTTTIDVQGETQIGGLLARVGQRMMGNASKSLMKQFFDGIEKAAKSSN